GAVRTGRRGDTVVFWLASLAPPPGLRPYSPVPLPLHGGEVLWGSSSVPPCRFRSTGERSDWSLWISPPACWGSGTKCRGGAVRRTAGKLQGVSWLASLAPPPGLRPYSPVSLPLHGGEVLWEVIVRARFAGAPRGRRSWSGDGRQDRRCEQLHRLAMFARQVDGLRVAPVPRIPDQVRLEERMRCARRDLERGPRVPGVLKRGGVTTRTEVGMPSAVVHHPEALELPIGELLAVVRRDHRAGEGETTPRLAGVGIDLDEAGHRHLPGLAHVRGRHGLAGAHLHDLQPGQVVARHVGGGGEV